jgi:hypothetical protein
MDTSIYRFILETRRPEVDNLDTTLGGLLEQNIFGLQVCVNDPSFRQETERI